MAVKITTREDIEANGGNVYTTTLDGHRVTVTEFDSINRFAAFDYPDKRGDGTAWTYGPWKEFQTYEATCEAIRTGTCPEDVLETYRALCDNLEAHVQELSALMPSAKRQRRRGIEGDEISIERVMVHDSDVWDRRVRGAKKQTVRLFINFSYNSNDGVDSFIAGVVRGIALADVLTTLGHVVEITACSFSRRWDVAGKPELAVTAPLKAADQPLDAQQLLMLALPSFQRLFKFGIWQAFAPDVDYGVAKVTAAHVEHFGIDVFSSGRVLAFEGDDSTPDGGHIAEIVSRINATQWSNL